MIIGIDYDNTYSADPETFNKVIETFKAAGHDVICVTGRNDGAMGVPVRNSIGKLVPVIFAGSESKRTAAKKRGYYVNVWIDDMPSMIDEDDFEELEQRAYAAMQVLNSYDLHMDKAQSPMIIGRKVISDSDGIKITAIEVRPDIKEGLSTGGAVLPPLNEDKSK